MKKLLKRAAALALAALMTAGLMCVSAEAAGNGGEYGLFTENDLLSAYGSLLRTADGRTLTLRGTNFGGWLIWEQWMGSFTGADDNLGAIEKLESRFGKEKTAALLNAYYDNYITEYDFDRVKELGFNCIRLPFWYYNVTAEGGYDFTRLDYAVEMCARRGVYVILDCHGLPGFQSIAHHCGKTGSCVLYDKTPEGEKARKDSCDLWTALAEHYRDNPCIAAYDLMNEPMCDFNEKQDDAAMWEVYDLLYKTVKAADPSHITIMEAIWDFSHLPDPARFGWDNVMYELHSYDETDDDYRRIIRNAKKKCYEVPILEGEFHPKTENAHWDYMLGLFNDKYVSWTSWTYKGYCSWGESDWFIYGYNDKNAVADLDRDSYDDILEKWTEPVRTENCSVTGAEKELSSFAKAPLKKEKAALFRAFLENVFHKIKSLFFRIFR